MNTEADRRAKALEDAVREALLWRQERLVPICLGTTAYHQALAGLGELVLRRGAIGHLDDLELVLQTGRENDRAREVLASAALVALWFIRCGPGHARMRRNIVRAGLAAFVLWMIVFKPVWNGDMGIYRWKLRFAPDPKSRRRKRCCLASSPRRIIP